MAYEDNQELNQESKDNTQRTYLMQSFSSSFVIKVDDLDEESIKPDSTLKGKWLSNLWISLIQKCKLMN